MTLRNGIKAGKTVCLAQLGQDSLVKIRDYVKAHGSSYLHFPALRRWGLSIGIGLSSMLTPLMTSNISWSSVVASELAVPK